MAVVLYEVTLSLMALISKAVCTILAEKQLCILACSHVPATSTGYQGAIVKLVMKKQITKIIYCTSHTVNGI